MELTTGSFYDPDFYGITISEAISQAKPFILVFSSPAFCTNAVCGPQLEVLRSIKTKYNLLNERIEQIYPGKMMFSGMVNVLNDLDDILNLSMVVYKWVLIGSGVSVALFLFVLIPIFHVGATTRYCVYCFT